MKVGEARRRLVRNSGLAPGVALTTSDRLVEFLKAAEGRTLAQLAASHGEGGLVVQFDCSPESHARFPTKEISAANAETHSRGTELAGHLETEGRWKMGDGLGQPSPRPALRRADQRMRYPREPTPLPRLAERRQGEFSI